MSEYVERVSYVNCAVSGPILPGDDAVLVLLAPKPFADLDEYHDGAARRGIGPRINVAGLGYRVPAFYPVGAIRGNFDWNTGLRDVRPGSVDTWADWFGLDRDAMVSDLILGGNREPHRFCSELARVHAPQMYLMDWIKDPEQFLSRLGLVEDFAWIHPESPSLWVVPGDNGYQLMSEKGPIELYDDGPDELVRVWARETGFHLGYPLGFQRQVVAWAHLSGMWVAGAVWDALTDEPLPGDMRWGRAEYDETLESAWDDLAAIPSDEWYDGGPHIDDLKMTPWGYTRWSPLPEVLLPDPRAKDNMVRVARLTVALDAVGRELRPTTRGCYAGTRDWLLALREYWSAIQSIGSRP